MNQKNTNIETYTIPFMKDENIVLTVAEKYFRVDGPWNVEIVRRDSKFTSGYMSPYQIQRCADLEDAVELVKELEEAKDNVNK